MKYLYCLENGLHTEVQVSHWDAFIGGVDGPEQARSLPGGLVLSKWVRF